MKDQIKSVFLNKYFYVFLIIFFLWFWYFFSPVFSGWLSFWSEKQTVNLWQGYIKKSDFDDWAVSTVLVNTKLGKWEYNNTYFFTNAVNLVDKAQELINIDTIELLDWTSNKLVVLESHLKQIEISLDKMQTQIELLKDFWDERRSDATNCENLKKNADSMFFQWVKSNEVDSINEWLNESVINWPCYMKNRTLSNAYMVLYDKLGFYKVVLQKKYNVITANQDMILQNFEMFRNNNLEKLISIRNELSNFKVQQD